MIVVDASALIEVLMCTDLGLRIEARLFDGDELLNAPHLLDVEVFQVMRGLVRARVLTPDAAIGKIEKLQQVDVIRHPHVDLAHRIFDLRHNLTAYDATYLALAERLDAILVTGDGVFAGVASRQSRVEVWQ